MDCLPVLLYRQFNQLNDEEKQLYVGGRYRSIPIVSTAPPDLEIINDIDEDDNDALVVFFMHKRKQKLLPLKRGPQFIKIILSAATAKHVVCGVVIMLLQRPNLKRWLVN